MNTLWQDPEPSNTVATSITRCSKCGDFYDSNHTHTCYYTYSVKIDLNKRLLRDILEDILKELKDIKDILNVRQ